MRRLGYKLRLGEAAGASFIVLVVLPVMALSVLALSVMGCSGGSADGSPAGGASAAASKALKGKVRSLTGLPLSGVAVSLGVVREMTGMGGTFSLDADPGDGRLLRFEKEGYLPLVKRVDIDADHGASIEVRMAPVGEPQALDAEEGGQVVTDDGAALMAAALSFVDAFGNEVTGEVQVSLTTLDPSDADQLQAFPGDLRAQRTAGDTVALESFGVVDVTVRQNGQKLQVKDGASVTLRIPVADAATDPPAEMPIWSFDEETGVWKEEGVGTYIAADRVYEVEIGHFSYWNADMPMETTCIRGEVVGADGGGVAGASVRGTGVDYRGYSEATADDDGVFCIAVRKDSRVRLTTWDGRGGLAQKEVDSGSAPTAVPPVCGDEACLDVGELVLEAFDCSAAGNPFSGTCASGLVDAMSCFTPSGSCSMSYTDEQVTIEYGSGEKIQMDRADSQESQESQHAEMFGADGNLCVSFDIEGDDTKDSYSQTIHTPSGDEWNITTGEDGGWTVLCTNGETVTLTGAQVDTWSACYGGEDVSEDCAMDFSGAGGPGGCSSDSDCEGGQVCCSAFGVAMCTDRQQCDSISAMTCSSDADCEGGMVCCGNGAFRVCVPPDSCAQ